MLKVEQLEDRLTLSLAGAATPLMVINPLQQSEGQLAADLNQMHSDWDCIHYALTDLGGDQAAADVYAARALKDYGRVQADATLLNQQASVFRLWMLATAAGGGYDDDDPYDVKAVMDGWQATIAAQSVAHSNLQQADALANQTFPDGFRFGGDPLRTSLVNILLHDENLA